MMKKYLILLPIILAGLVAYLPSLKYGFSQDDFIFLYISKVETLSDFFNFFNPFAAFPDFFFYRPLTTQVFYFINQTLFSLNPLPAHIESLIFHLINSILFYFIIKKVWPNKFVAFLSALFFAISAVHFLSLFYIAAFQEIGRTFFVFLSLFLFLKYLDRKKKVYYVGSIVAFIFSLLSKETSLILPLLFFPFALIKNDKEKILYIIKDLTKRIIPFIIIIFIFILFRFFGFRSVFHEGSYNLTFSIFEIAQNLKWYLIWSFGLPEILSSWPSLKLQSLLGFGKSLPFANFVLIAFVFLMASNIIALFLKFKYIPKKKFLSLIAIFLISLSPVLLLSNHRYPHYADLALLGFLPILAWLFYSNFANTSQLAAGMKQSSDQTCPKGYSAVHCGVVYFRDVKKVSALICLTGIFSFIILQFYSLNLSEKTHWTVHRAQVADFYHNNFVNNYPFLPEKTKIIFTGTQQSANELSFALAQKYALLVWYPNKVTSVQYKTPDEEISYEEKTIIYPVSLY